MLSSTLQVPPLPRPSRGDNSETGRASPYVHHLALGSDSGESPVKIGRAPKELARMRLYHIAFSAVQQRAAGQSHETLANSGGSRTWLCSIPCGIVIGTSSRCKQVHTRVEFAFECRRKPHRHVHQIPRRQLRWRVVGEVGDMKCEGLSEG